jgi:hypothetical protein
MHDARSDVHAGKLSALDITRLQPGDILLSRIPMNLDNTSTWDSHLIQTMTRSRFSHAALYIDNGLCIEAVGSGIARLSLIKAGIRDSSNMRLLRVRKQNDGQYLSAGRKAAAYGQRYLQRGFCQSRLPCAKATAFHDVRRAAVMNSGMVASAYADAEFQLFGEKSPYDVFPGDFLQCPQLEDVTETALALLPNHTEITFCLDDCGVFERVQHWEVATQLKILCNFDVRRILDIEARRPSSFHELELLIADKRWSALDEAVNRGLMWYRYSNVYQQKLRNFLGNMELEASGIARLSSLLSQHQLASAALLVNNDIHQLETERTHWQQQLNFYDELRQKFPTAKTFVYLSALYGKLLETSVQWLKSKQQQERFYSEEARRRGFRLKTA